MLFFSAVNAFMLLENRVKRFIGKRGNEIVLINDGADAVDLSLQPTDKKDENVILSLGTIALAYDKILKKIVTKDFENDDKELHFRMILAADGSYMIQHNDQCVGFKKNNELNNFIELILTNCNDEAGALRLTKGDSVKELLTQENNPQSEFIPLKDINLEKKLPPMPKPSAIEPKIPLVPVEPQPAQPKSYKYF